MSRLEKVLLESSLSRVWSHMQEHDCGTITAWRSRKLIKNEDGECVAAGDKYTRAENKARNYLLKAKIQSKRYDITMVDGSYIENFGSPDAVENNEPSFFIVDVSDRGNLESDLTSWGEDFEQDSIMFIPKPGEKARLVGTSRCVDSRGEPVYPGYRKVINYNGRQWGKTGMFFTRVNGRPFFFKESATFARLILPEGYFGRMGCAGVANMKWQDIKL